jgi:hypothetical protein
LTREVVGFVLARNPDSYTTNLPLAWLLASCAGCRATVDDEISAAIAEMVASPEPRSRVEGLRLATSLDTPLWNRGSEWPDHELDGPQLEFWETRRKEFTQEYSAAIVESAADHGDLLNVAVHAGLRTAEQAIAVAGCITPLLLPRSDDMFCAGFSPYLMGRPENLALEDDPGTVAAARTDFEAVGRFLVVHPHTPWATQAVEPWTGYFWISGGEPTAAPTDLTPLTCLGAAATLLVSAEGDQPIVRDMLNNEVPELGRLDVVYPYIRHRLSWEKRSLPLPDLPVPEEFKQVFKDWADRTIDFTADERSRVAG